jgi:ribosome-binding protein aMBF1 (putative translation factor)
MTKKQKSKDALDILYDRYYKGHPEREASLEEERANMEIARKIYDLRTKAGLTQKELAKRVGTTASVICRLEDADYEGHSLSMLRRIASALGKKVEIRFVSVGSK